HHHEFAIVNFVFGGLGLLNGAVQYVKNRRAQSDHATMYAHREEAGQRIDRGETPNQIADAFEREYKIPPSRTLVFLARIALRFVAEKRDPEDEQFWLRWLSSNREQQPAPARDLIKAFDARRNLLGVSGGAHPLAPSRGSGALFASRSYLYFFAIEHES